MTGNGQKSQSARLRYVVGLPTPLTFLRSGGSESSLSSLCGAVLGSIRLWLRLNCAFAPRRAGADFGEFVV